MQFSVLSVLTLLAAGLANAAVFGESRCIQSQSFDGH